MKSEYVSPSLEIFIFKTEDVLTASNAGGIILLPSENGGEVEIGGGINLF